MSARWRDDALCAQTDPDVFFPDLGGTAAAARKVCAECRVRLDCLGYALVNEREFGIYAGLTPRERARVTFGDVLEVRS